jgi:Winged helix DNA-binding domain
VDAPAREVAARWPEDVEAVEVDGQRLDILAEDAQSLGGAEATGAVRLLGPFDVFLQGRDRELVVPDAAARKELWRPLGRPGAVLAGDEIVGSWRPRASGKKLRLAVSVWDGSAPPAGLDAEAERLAASRGVSFAGYVDA